MVTKVDLKKKLKRLYGPSAREVSVVDVPRMNFLMIEGQGDPNTSEEYADALEALYAVSYAIKFRVKRSEDIDYGVMPLEGLWWTDLEVDGDDHAARGIRLAGAPRGNKECGRKEEETSRNPEIAF